jgi:hypothetical protein
VSDAGNPLVAIYVRLLDEGTDCSPPTRALLLGEGLFKLLPTENYNPDDETIELVGRLTVVRRTPCSSVLFNSC